MCLSLVLPTRDTRRWTIETRAWWTSGITSERDPSFESPGYRRGWFHRRVRGGGAPRARLRGDRPGQFLQVRSAGEELLEASALRLARGRREGCGSAQEARCRLRSSDRRCRDDRRDQLLPRVRLRAISRERANHRLHF